MRRSTKRPAGDVRTSVEVGSDASPGSQRINLRCEMVAIIGVLRLEKRQHSCSGKNVEGPRHGMRGGAVS